VTCSSRRLISSTCDSHSVAGRESQEGEDKEDIAAGRVFADLRLPQVENNDFVFTNGQNGRKSRKIGGE
jgi:hypothetical protein